MNADVGKLLTVGTESDNPFAIDISAYCRQEMDVADVMSLKTFANSEFCPRFISDERYLENIGNTLRDTVVVVVSTGSSRYTRNELAWRNLVVTRAAHDNGARQVVLIEPDLFFSAQDRGPRPEHGELDARRGESDYKKFDGQAFTSLLYAQLLALAGVHAVITVHNHSSSVQRLFRNEMNGGFLNLSPAEVFADYIRTSDVAPSLHNGKGMLLCAPDGGARAFVDDVHRELAMPEADVLYIDKKREGERDVSSFIATDSPSSIDDIAGRDVIVFDDMVRTGGTIRECCRLLKAAGAGRMAFFVTHFYSSQEVRLNLHGPELDEIVTTNTIPSILNRDSQGRLRRKLTVLKLEKWISRYVMDFLGRPADHLQAPLYTVDMSSKNPRWQQR